MLYSITRTLAWIVSKILFRFKLTGLENIPKKGAFILCANHISWFDAVALAVFLKRRPRFMAKKELFKVPLFGWYLNSLGAYPIKRSAADMTAFRTTMNILNDGGGLIIFSQGTRMKEFENAKGGVALFALKSGAPIIPAGIIGNYRFFSRMKIRFGEPILMDEYKGKKVKTELIDEIMNNVVFQVSSLCKA
ncbi:MAG: 1-acyl-sn-glycerol-3-phosphate acyltransferase [Defluviitaleaceae bacterium]|nr:1-acyl-sn-glycerol-3-phosphate acyltransferase [Defluviitaleaceae bacterium]